MSIPDYQTLMLPVLEAAADGAEHRMSDVVSRLSDTFALSDEDREELLPSGHQRTISNRVGWAKTYLAKAGLLDGSRRGYFKITPRGNEVLASKPTKIDVSFLRRFPEFEEFRTATSAETSGTIAPTAVESQETPEELLERGYVQLRSRLSEELAERVRTVSPSRFETVVLEVLLAMGYGGSRPDAGKAVGRSGDGGIDGLINEDPLGLDVVYIQAKRWDRSVGRPEVQAFVGSLEGQRARKGVLITTSTFSSDAKEYVKMIDKRVILIDGLRLAGLMMDNGVGVTDDQQYIVKRIDLDYFDEQVE
jgi:restriction system protein